MRTRRELNPGHTAFTVLVQVLTVVPPADHDTGVDDGDVMAAVEIPMLKLKARDRVSTADIEEL